MPPKPRSVLDRMWEKVDFTETCWLWTGTTNERPDGQGGYGFIMSGPAPKYRDVPVHVLSYIYFNGVEPAPGMDVDHLCRVRRCLRPDHLELVTHQVNLLRGEGYSHVVARTNFCGNGHELIGHNAKIEANGKRRCRTCWNERRARRRQELRALGYSASEIASKA